jgi:DnaJ-class molecular chaperone
VPQHIEDASGKPLCLTCHGTLKSDSLANVIIPGISTCRACHGAKSPAGTEIAGSNCTECHGYHSLDEPPTREIYMGPWRIPSGM